MPKVHLLTIEHRYGTNHHVCDSEETAEKILARYVADSWVDEMDGPMPHDPEKAVELYFEQMRDCSNPEFYSIEREPILTDDDVRSTY